MVIDLGRVAFVDSSGLGSLISALKVLRANGGDLKLANIGEQVYSVLEMTRLLRVFDTYETSEQALSALEKLERKFKQEDRDGIYRAALSAYLDAEELKPYQAELIKLQRHLEVTGRKVIILFDGRDASGKGGTIRRVTRYMNEKHYRVVALGKPSVQQQTERGSASTRRASWPTASPR